MSPNEEMTKDSEKLSGLPPSERFSVAINDPRFAVKPVFYSTFGIPTEFTRFGIFRATQTGQIDDRAQRFLGEEDFVASISRQEMKGSLNENQQAILDVVCRRRSEFSHRITSLHNVFQDRTGIVVKAIRKVLGLYRETETPQDVQSAIFDLLDRAHQIWQDLEPAVFKNAIGQGEEVTMEMVDARFDQLAGVIQAKEEEFKTLREKLSKQK